MGHNNIIELNGRQYDAVTGELLGTSRIKATPASRAQAVPASSRSRRVIDGMVRAAQASAALAPAAKAKVTATPTAANAKKTGKKFDVQRPQTAPLNPHRAQQAQTLMRHTVKKPDITRKPAIKKSTPSELAAKPVSDISSPLEKKVAVTQVHPLRLAHAQHVAKSHHIRRFNHAQATHQPTPTVTPVQPQRQAADIRPQPATALALTAATDTGSEDIFEKALARATSHSQPAHKPASRKAVRHRRLVSAFAGLAAFLVIGGFITYLNLPGIELRVASIRAGFHASLPEYQPTGYALNGGFQSSEGSVAMSYRSGDSSYRITQIASDWNSQTLLDYYTETYGKPDQTVQSQGRTIYLYDNTHAAWVNGGVRYEITGNASLTDKDLVSLATSM